MFAHTANFSSANCNPTPMVLLIDDVPANLDVLVAQLGQENIDIRIALSGEEGLQLAHRLRPDLILLDVMMPGLDGYQVCQLLKRDPELAEIPVVFLTARDEEVEVERGFALGAVDYIHKPFSMQILKARVRSHLALKRKGDLLTKLACTDGLTGIANRRHFDASFAREWARSQRNQQPLSLVMIDLDYFKLYNDHYGHSAGDQCLKSVARAISEELHRPGDLLARFGGEEFVALLPATDLDNAKHLAEKLHQAVAKLALPHARSQASEQVSICLGVACTQPGNLKPNELLATADSYLYQAKQQGRNRVVARPV